MKLSNTSVALAAAGVGGYLLLARSHRAKAKAPKPPSPPPSPFVRGSNCTTLASQEQIDLWLTQRVAPLIEPRLDAFSVPRANHAEGRAVFHNLINEVFAAAVPECSGNATAAMRKVWTWLWCDGAAELARRGKIDDEVDQLVAMCADPTFDPRLPPTSGHGPKHPPPTPPIPKPTATMVPPLEPLDGASAPPPPSPPLPPNWRALSTRDQLSAIGVMGLMEGQRGAVPIVSPASNLVMLAYDPGWAANERARADLEQLAHLHPRLHFVEVSFVDTQRHFGKPKAIGEIAWAIAAAGPDGRVSQEPIVRSGGKSRPPNSDEWDKVVAHASGFVGSPKLRSVPRPKRFGDITRAMVAQRARQRRSAVTASKPARRGVRPRRR